MPCDTVKNVPPVIRKAQIEEALERLEKALQGNQVKLVIGQNGAIAFNGWTKTSRDFVTDACAFRRLTVKGSWALKQAVARAESIAGRKVNMAAVSAGVHSHDGGITWSGKD